MRFLSSFYVLNVLLLTAYAFARVWFVSREVTPYSRLTSHAGLLHWEKHAAAVLVVIIAFKVIKRRSLDEVFQEAILYTKITFLFLIWKMDVRLAAMFLLAAAVIYTVVQPPRYDGPRSYSKLFTPQSFEDSISTQKDRERAKSSGDKDFGKDRSRYWLVLFGAPWNSESAAVTPLFGGLSEEYGSEGLRFGEVDIAAWPQLADSNKISDRLWDGQLPSLILYDGGKEIARLPSGPVTRQTRQIRRKDIVSAFGLGTKFSKQ